MGFNHLSRPETGTTSPNTVAKAVESLGPLPIQMLTLHTAGGGEMMRAAQAAQQKTNPKLLLARRHRAHLDGSAGLNENRRRRRVRRAGRRLGKLAADPACAGSSARPLEVQPAPCETPPTAARHARHPPGQRGRQRRPERVMTPPTPRAPAPATSSSARPILQAADPAAAARAILAELAAPEPGLSLQPFNFQPR